MLSDHYDKIKSLYDNHTKTSEFEFIFFSKKEKQLTLEKYIDLLKYLSNRSIANKKEALINNKILLDIIYSENRENTYRATLEGNEYIDSYMKRIIKASNHIILKNIVLQAAKDKKIILSKKDKLKSNTLDIDDYYLRIRLSDESDITNSEIKMLTTLDHSQSNNIIFRSKQRTSLIVVKDDNGYVKIDLTITKMNTNFSLLNMSIPKYELEIETMSKKKRYKIY